MLVNVSGRLYDDAVRKNTVRVWDRNITGAKNFLLNGVEMGRVKVFKYL